MDESLSVQLSIPVYFTQEFKTKKSKIHLTGMNWFRNAHWSLQDKVKKHYSDIVKDIFKDIDIDEPWHKYKASYTYFYKNRLSDLPNVCSIMSKFVNDALQEIGLVIDDNVQYYIQETYKVGGLDKTNPRVEIKLERI